MTRGRRILAAFLIAILCVVGYLLGVLYWNGIQEGEGKLYAYPITLLPDGSGIYVHGSVDMVRIGNATHLTGEDFRKHPAIEEVLTGERSVFRGFSKMGGVSMAEYHVIAKDYFISEYEGRYYVLVVQIP